MIRRRRKLLFGVIRVCSAKLHSKQSDQQLLIRPLGIDNLAVARKGRTQKFSSLGAGKYWPMPRYRYLILAIFLCFPYARGASEMCKKFSSSPLELQSRTKCSDNKWNFHCSSLSLDSTKARKTSFVAKKKKKLEKQQDNMFMSLCVFRFTIINVENET